MAENIKSNVVKNHGEATTVENWISQINAGGQVYDIATHHGITFKDGNTDSTGVTWNGLTDLEVVIPNITDIVQTPIEFAGTVGANGEVNWVNGHTAPAEAGNLVFITADCTFNTIACEAGDMAIYDGSKWNVVSGENQVEILGTMENNTSTIAIGEAKNVLTVEGKTLALSLDYANFNSHVEKTEGEQELVNFNKMTVDKTYLKLDTKNETKTIGDTQEIDLPTKLSDGTVTLTNAENIVTTKTIDFGTFDGGKMPTIVMNEKKEFNVTGGSVSLIDGNDVVTSVSLDNVTLVSASTSDSNSFSLVTDIKSEANGTEFLTSLGIASKGESADLVISGFKPSAGLDTTFVTGISGGLSPITSITKDSFTLDPDGDGTIVTGLSTSVINDNTGDVLTDVIVTPKPTNVLGSATVVSNVLILGETQVTNGVEVTYKSKNLTTTGYKFTPVEYETSNFTTSGFAIHDVNLTFSKANEKTYTLTSSLYKLNTPELSVQKGAYLLSNEGMKVSVSASTFAVNIEGGEIATWTPGNTTGVTITGSVNTDLDKENVTIHTLADSYNSLSIPTYTLVSGSEEDYDVIVGKEGDLAANSASINLEGYIKDFTFK